MTPDRREGIDDVAENIREDQHDPGPRTLSVETVRQVIDETLRTGVDGGYRHTERECPECGATHEQTIESVGPDLNGFRALVDHTRLTAAGYLDEAEYRALCHAALDATLYEALDGEDDAERLDEAVHRTLDEFDGERARLAFSTHLIDKVLDGEKTATVRYDLDPERLEPGSRVELVTSREGRVFAVAYVADIIPTTVENALSAVDAAGYQHDAETTGTLRINMNDYYDDDIDLSTEVEVVLLDDIGPVLSSNRPRNEDKSWSVEDVNL